MATAKDEQQAADETQAELEEAQTATSDPADETKSMQDQESDSNTGEADGESNTPKAVTKAGKHSAKALREEEEEASRKEASAQKSEKPKVKQQKVNPLKRHGKNYRQASEMIEVGKEYELTEAIELAKKTSLVKFVPSVELHVNLGVDPRQADQMVRASVVLPAGTGKTLRVAVLAPAAKQADAKKAGADIVGEDDLIAAIEKGTLNFDKLIATPDLMPKLSKLAKILGPKGLMPNPKSGSVTPDVAKAVAEAKAGKVEFRIDKQGIIHQVVGKTNFDSLDLLANSKTLIDAIMKAKPAATKGTYVRAMAMTTTMGPGIKLDVTKAIAAANPKK